MQRFIVKMIVHATTPVEPTDRQYGEDGSPCREEYE
jgi:hypothetical protein